VSSSDRDHCDRTVIDARLADAVLTMMERNMRAEVVDDDRFDFAAPRRA
jgi:hypothetical protein